MDFLSDPQFWAKWSSIVLLDIVLAGDNALVIALAVRSLPAKQQFWGRVYGTAGAITLRLLFIVLVTWLLNIPLLRLIGGLVLFWIAYKLVAHSAGGEENVHQGATLREAIVTIIIADVVMSFDNVVAISATARGDLVLVIFGLVLSVPLVVSGSGLLAKLMNRFPVIIWLGGGVLGFVAARMILDDPWVAQTLSADLMHGLHLLAPGVIGIVFTLLGWRHTRAASPPDKSPE